MLAFDFSLTVKKGKKPKQRAFTGPFVNGPAYNRFVYLSWRVIQRGNYINRVKARLGTIDWKLVLAAQRQGRPITADVTGGLSGDLRRHVDWYLG